MSIAILLNGPPGCGKDTLGNAVAEYINWPVMTFKAELFKATCECFGVTLAWFMEDYDDNKDIPTPILHGKTKRQALIITSELLIKPAEGSDYFGKMAAKHLRSENYTGVVFTDSGFMEELMPIYCEVDKLVVVQLHRTGCKFKPAAEEGGDSRNYLSERLLPKDVVCFHYYNNSSVDIGVKAIISTVMSYYLAEILPCL